jgi:hypothetical protein
VKPKERRENREGEKESLKEITHGKESFIAASFDLLIPFYCWTYRERDERTERDLRENLRRRMSMKGKRSWLYLY